MTLLPQIDVTACAAHSDCADIAPQVFRLDDVAVVIGTGPDELILAAAASCPSAAITVLDSSTRRDRLPVAATKVACRCGARTLRAPRQ